MVEWVSIQGLEDEMNALINIGMRARSGRELSKAEVDFALQALGFDVVAAEVMPDPEEDTFVAYVRGGDAEGIHDVALFLDQDAIAVWDNDSGKGHLAGPDVASWEPFDSSRFKSL